MYNINKKSKCSNDPRLSQWKWDKTVEVNGAYKHDKFGNIWFEILCVMSNFKVFAMQDHQPASRTNLTHQIYPYVTHIDQKWLDHSLVLYKSPQVTAETSNMLFWDKLFRF